MPEDMITASIYVTITYLLPVRIELFMNYYQPPTYYAQLTFSVYFILLANVGLLSYTIMQPSIQ
jgi:hypothetical protein